MAKLFLLWGSINMFLGVALGAFGAHGLKERISERMLANWNTGVHYHMVHALGLILLAVLVDKLQATESLVGWSGKLLLAGIVLFSGSLYVMALTNQTKLGAITPLGGVAFLAGWVLLAVAAAKSL
ncbi:DUF423 domain-containing protein [Paenibacillus turpanensis]|uniref:DUF423 domain-containing protein n=1 Tax=Paenibacillus turpanensis TaxID=2689078 RepID=UPI00140A4DF8